MDMSNEPDTAIEPDEIVIDKSEIITLEDIKDPVAVLFAPAGTQPLLDDIAASVATYEIGPHMLETAQGRELIASVAYRIGKTKVLIDGLGKALVAGIKKQSGEIDAERKRTREYLDALKIETRRPLTEYEARIDAQQQEMQGVMERIISARVAYTHQPSDVITDAITKLAGIELAPFTPEQVEAITTERDRTRQTLVELLIATEATEKQAAELMELRREKAEREAKDEADKVEANAKQQQADDKAAAVRGEREAQAEAERLRVAEEKRVKRSKVRRQKVVDGIRASLAEILGNDDDIDNVVEALVNNDVDNVRVVWLPESA
jgi:colicin import membrane protein